MTDLEITRLCAEAMGLLERRYGKNDEVSWVVPGEYDPLHDDAQAMALEDWLAERGTVVFEYGHYCHFDFTNQDGETTHLPCANREQRRRCAVECVAKMQLQEG